MATSAKVYQYKLVLLGESAVGKSSLVLRFVKNSFSDHQESTIGAAFLTQTLQHDGDTLKFEIWDTAGQERYNSLAPMYYRGAHAAVVVYDITKKDSFERAKKWVSELLRNASPNIVIALVGNKLDLSDSARQVSTEKGRAYAAEANLLFTECSARTGDNVAQVFDMIAEKLPKTDQQLATPRLGPGEARRVALGARGSAGTAVLLFIGPLTASWHSGVPQFKRVDVMLFGQAAVGKTSISERITTGNFNEGTTATIGADHSIVKNRSSDGSMKEFVLWDTAGQERFAQMSGLYYRRAQIAIVVYSVCCPKSFMAATESVERLYDENPKNPAIILVGSKADQDEGLHMGLPLTELAAVFCQKNDLQHLLVSSKENINIEPLTRWIRSEIEKMEAAEIIELENKASVDSGIIQLDLDEDYVARGNGRHAVLDDSCC